MSATAVCVLYGSLLVILGVLFVRENRRVRRLGDPAPRDAAIIRRALEEELLQAYVDAALLDERAWQALEREMSQ